MKHLPLVVRLKYVIVEPESCPRVPVPIVFAGLIAHADMKSHGRPISAGYCFRNAAGEFVAHGSSCSLQLESRGAEDAKILNDWFAPSSETPPS